jgi:hypothetical protein
MIDPTLRRIRAIVEQWSEPEGLSDAEAMAQIVEALERIGMPNVREVSSPERDRRNDA